MHTHIYTYIYIYKYKDIYTLYITMINPSNSSQTIVTLPQIKDILAKIIATKIKARTNKT